MTNAMELNRMSAFELDSVNGGIIVREMNRLGTFEGLVDEKQNFFARYNIIHWTA